MQGDRRYYVQRYDKVVQGIIDFLCDSGVSVKQAKYALRTARQHINNSVIGNSGVAVTGRYRFPNIPSTTNYLTPKTRQAWTFYDQMDSPVR